MKHEERSTKNAYSGASPGHFDANRDGVVVALAHVPQPDRAVARARREDVRVVRPHVEAHHVGVVLRPRARRRAVLDVPLHDRAVAGRAPSADGSSVAQPWVGSSSAARDTGNFLMRAAPAAQ